MDPQKTPWNAAEPCRGACDHTPRARHVLVALAMFALGACGAVPGTTDAVPGPPPPSAVAPADFKVIAARALSTVAYPAAAVVLSVRERKVLGVAEVNGGDAANTALRPGSTMKPLLAYAAIERGIGLGTVVCDGSYHGLTCPAQHAYAPISAPEIVVAVEITGPGAGSTTPASVAGEILRSWFATRSLAPAANREAP